MNFTLAQFAYQAARDLGCIRAGQTLAPDIVTDIQTAANEMLDVWMLDELIVLETPAQVFNMTAGTQIYTIGPNEVSPNFTAARPNQIYDANIILNTVSPVLRTPLEIIDVDQWADIRIQTLPNALPLRLYYERSYSTTPTVGAARMLFWPGPLNAYQFELFTGDQVVLGQFTDTTTAHSFPPAYAQLIRKQLAVAIAPLMNMYCKSTRMEPGTLMAPQADMLARVERQAAEAMSAVQAFNAKEEILIGDPAWRGGERRMGWNYLTGTNGRAGR